MSTSQFLGLLAGLPKAFTALVTSAGASDANKIVMTDSAGRLDTSLMPVGIGPLTQTIQASENLAAGDFVNVHDSTGSRVRKADAANSRIAHGFVLTAVTSGQNATVYTSGLNTALTGLTPGQTRWLSNSAAGTSTATPPTTANHLLQVLGTAYSATSLLFEFNEPIQL